MHATRDQLPILFGTDPAGIRGADWGNLRATFVSIPAGTDITPLLKGLPDNRCPCPHWGYVLTGRMVVTSADGEEPVRAGELFYMPPGHTLAMEQDVEYVEFSPSVLAAGGRATITPAPSRRGAGSGKRLALGPLEPAATPRRGAAPRRSSPR